MYPRLAPGATYSATPGLGLGATVLNQHTVQHPPAEPPAWFGLVLDPLGPAWGNIGCQGTASLPIQHDFPPKSSLPTKMTTTRTMITVVMMTMVWLAMWPWWCRWWRWRWRWWRWWRWHGLQCDAQSGFGFGSDLPPTPPPPPASSQFTLGSCRTQLFFSSLEFLGDLAGTGVVLLLLLVILLALLLAAYNYNLPLAPWILVSPNISI